MTELEKSVQQSYPSKKTKFEAWMRETIATTSPMLIGNEVIDGEMRDMEVAIAMGIQNRIGENIPARKWYVVLASIPSSVLSPKYHAKNA